MKRIEASTTDNFRHYSHEITRDKCYKLAHEIECGMLTLIMKIMLNLSNRQLIRFFVEIITCLLNQPWIL